MGEISLPIVSGVLGSGSGWLEDEPEVSGWVEASGSGLVGSGSKYHDYFDDDSVEDPFAGFVLDEILGDAIDVGASDVHITPEQEVRFTILGEISNRGYRVPSGDLTQRVMQSILSNVVESVFVQELEVDTSYVIRSGKYRGRRLRVGSVKRRPCRLPAGRAPRPGARWETEACAHCRGARAGLCQASDLICQTSHAARQIGHCADNRCPNPPHGPTATPRKEIPHEDPRCRGLEGRRPIDHRNRGPGRPARG